MIYTGYLDNQKGYRLMNPKIGKGPTARDVKFLAKIFLVKGNTEKSEVELT